MNNSLILVTGATGYVGGRLVPRLLELGYRVRCLVRDPDRLQGRVWREQVEIFQGDALQIESLQQAMQGVTLAYYLIHGMQGGKANSGRDLQAAQNFAAAAEFANIERIIYLGELVDPASQLSPYLRARHETGYILRRGRIPVTEFRAGMIIGSGSALFEMIRYLAEREPVLVCPKWFFSLAQPIAIRNVLDYLTAAIPHQESTGKLIEIGGSEQLRYADMLLVYSRLRGLKRFLIRTPVYAPRLSAFWVHMLTPIHWRMVLPLIEGLHAESLVYNPQARTLFPEIEILDFESAVRLALGRIEQGDVETSWSDALVTSAGDIQPYTFQEQEGMMIERRQILLDLPARPVFKAFSGIGGERGWFYMDWAWSIRGWLDKLVGGVGLRRGRRDPNLIRVGESLDFWRVESLIPDRCMRLRAEMKVPGSAWLEFQAMPQSPQQTLLTLGAFFAPRGLGGFLYWYSMFPFHKFIFDGMIRQIAARARQIAQEEQ